MAETELDKARAEVEKEFEQFRERLGPVLEAMARVSDAGPLDDVYGLLDRLEETVKEARTGGAFGSGAKGHRSALEKYNDILGTGS